MHGAWLCMVPGIDLSKLTAAEKDALILSLLPLAGHLVTALARVAELEARLARFERPGKTPDNSSLPPSKGRKPERPSSGKPLRRSRPGFGRALEANPDRVVDAMLGACPHCAAAFPAGQQTPQQVHDPGAAVWRQVRLLRRGRARPPRRPAAWNPAFASASRSRPWWSACATLRPSGWNGWLR